MEPENGPLEDDFPLQPSGFQVPCSSSRVYVLHVFPVPEANTSPPSRFYRGMDFCVEVPRTTGGWNESTRKVTHGQCISVWGAVHSECSSGTTSLRLPRFALTLSETVSNISRCVSSRLGLCCETQCRGLFSSLTAFFHTVPWD